MGSELNYFLVALCFRTQRATAAAAAALTEAAAAAAAVAQWPIDAFEWMSSNWPTDVSALVHVCLRTDHTYYRAGPWI